jgi:predicted nucleic acid-binding protein
MSNYLLDTCIIIDFFRGNEQAISFMNSLTTPPFLSSLTIAELYAGVREGKERTLLDEFSKQFPIISLDYAQAKQGGLYRRQYSKSHNIGMIDALLAAIAIDKNLTLITKNLKHFPMLQNVLSPY